MLAQCPPAEIVGLLDRFVRAFQKRDLIGKICECIAVGDQLRIQLFVRRVEGVDIGAEFRFQIRQRCFLAIPDALFRIIFHENSPCLLVLSSSLVPVQLFVGSGNGLQKPFLSHQRIYGFDYTTDPPVWQYPVFSSHQAVSVSGRRMQRE
jgi:hypothetical protein